MPSDGAIAFGDLLRKRLLYQPVIPAGSFP